MRERIIEATFAVLMERGYAGASTLEIARRAKVSKRELYALFSDKQGILAAMIARRAERMVRPLELPDVADRAALAGALTEFGTTLLREVTHPSVTALFQLAIAEAERSPEMARLLDQGGRGANRSALLAFLARARANRLLGTADPAAMAGQFLGLLFSDLVLRLAMRTTTPPSPRVCAERATAATAALLTLNPAAS